MPQSIIFSKQMGLNWSIWGYFFAGGIQLDLRTPAALAEERPNTSHGPVTYTLQRRHMRNHRQVDCLFNILLGLTARKHQRSASLWREPDWWIPFTKVQ